jgi:hypothetical protein
MSKQELLENYMDDAQERLNDVYNPATQKAHKYTHFRQQIQGLSTLEEVGQMRDELKAQNIDSAELEQALDEQKQLIQAEAARIDDRRREEVNRQDLENAHSDASSLPTNNDTQVQENPDTGVVEENTKTRENTMAAAKAYDNVKASDYNTESVEAESSPAVVGDVLGVDSFHIKPNESIALAWVSPAVTKNLDTRSQLLADMIEDPKNDLVGRQVEYQVDAPYLESSSKKEHQQIAALLREGRAVPKELIGYLPTRVYILSEEGERISIDNNEIYGFVHDEGWKSRKDNRSLSDAEKLTIRNLKGEVLNHFLDGKSSLRAEITEQSTGEPFADPPRS